MVASSRLRTGSFVVIAFGLGAIACESGRSDAEANARLQETISRVDERLAVLDERLAQIEAKAELASAATPTEDRSTAPPTSPSSPTPTIAAEQPKPAKKIEVRCEADRYRVAEQTYDLAGLTALLEAAVDDSDPSVTIQCERGDTEAVLAALQAAKDAGVQRLAMMTLD